MTVKSKGRELFIVDNSVSGWTGIRYLEEWSSIAKAFDIATGYFEIGALLTLDGKWQGLDKIRILMGAETTHRTRNAILDAVRAQALDRLDESIEEDKEPNPFLHGVPAILDALRSGQIECRVYDKNKFHAKAYITHAKLEVVGAQALVGSSNFTRPGLTKNIELNVQIQSAREVAQLQEWFETHWAEAREVTETVIETISRHTHLYSPFDVYAKALQQFFRGHDLTATEWDETRSRMFPHLDRYQQEAYWALMKIARQHGGAFLCDGVGLGKTFVGLMLIERLILHEGKRVALFAPKATKEGVWEPHLRRWLPHIGGVGGGADFSNLAVFSHTDLGRKGDFPERFQRIAELADIVVIDEAHHFRNPGRRGDPDRGIEPSRYYRLFELLDNAERPKTVIMLTATPINNRLSDFRHMTELFTRRDEAYFARTIGVNNLRAHFNQMEKTLRSRVGQDEADAAEHMTEAQEILFTDAFFRQLVVQRSRDYARESQIREYGKAAAFPERRDPQVAAYSIRKTYGGMLELFEKAFAKQSPLFTLPMYYPLHWYRGPDKDIDPFEENRQRQVVGLIRTNFLKRFESSVAAFELSCDRLLQKLLAFLEVHSESDAEKKRLDRWKAQNADVLGYAVQRQLQLWGEEGKEADDEDVVPQEMLDAVERLDRAEYDVEEMIAETFLDLDQIVQFLDEARKFEPKHDDKLKKLIRLLKSKALADQKILIFTEFADTARYLKRHLDEAGIEGVEQVDSATKKNRSDVIQRFAPYYNGLSSPELAEQGREEIRVLISTDVLSEGLNLQDASRMAYCLTVHKTQGSEFGVTFVVLTNPCWLLSRELLYTALTRHKDRLVILHEGPLVEYRRYAGNEHSEIARRMTNLFADPLPREVTVNVQQRFLEEGLIHRTERGDLVRSKSELVIADKLHARGVDYAYEQPLVLPNGRTRYPDFTIADHARGVTFYWEHLGMLDDPGYRARWERKRAEYLECGIGPHEDGGSSEGTLIETRDEPGGRLDAAAIASVIDGVILG